LKRHVQFQAQLSVPHRGSPRCSWVVSGIFAGWFSRPSVDVGARGAAATAAISTPEKAAA
jgi:hypothetical protein